ncbi:hypothetical protein R4J09_14205 [Brachyspira intermedia]|uniref:hypothetical protein n=1 Tax=Brachyspira intermedia TaxID=84377 RepID=UPI0030048D83
MINDINYTKVKNKKGTGNDNPPKGYNSWKEYWEYVKKRKFGKCSNVKCTNKAEDGSHVFTYMTVSDSISKSKIVELDQYIVPLCKTCNNPNNEDDIEVSIYDLLKI